MPDRGMKVPQSSRERAIALQRRTRLEIQAGPSGRHCARLDRHRAVKTSVRRARGRARLKSATSPIDICSSCRSPAGSSRRPRRYRGSHWPPAAPAWSGPACLCAWNSDCWAWSSDRMSMVPSRYCSSEMRKASAEARTSSVSATSWSLLDATWPSADLHIGEGVEHGLAVVGDLFLLLRQGQIVLAAFFGRRRRWSAAARRRRSRRNCPD